MALPTSFTNPTGKTALFYSVQSWLQTNVPTANAADFTYAFLQDLGPSVMPRVEVSEFNFSDPGEDVFGGIAYPAAATGQQTEGQRQLAMLEVNIYVDGSKQTDALKHLRQVRDRIRYGLVNAGTTRDIDNAEILPPIRVLDPANSNFDTGIIARVKSEDDNAVTENFFKPQAPQSLIYRYQLLFKLEWYEMRN